MLFYLVAFLLEALVDGVFELIFALGWESLGHAIGRKKPTNPLFAGIGMVILGSLSGAISVLLFSDPIFPKRGFEGLSLIAAPVITGVFMKLFGDRRREQDKPVTVLATFWGGFIFGFAFSLARFLLLRFK